MQLEFISVEDAKAATLDKQRKLVEAFNKASADIDEAIIRQEAVCRAADTCLERRRNASLQRDPKFIEWLSKHHQMCLGKLDWIHELRYKLELHYNDIRNLNAQPVICTVRCGDTQDYTDCAKKVIGQISLHNATATNPRQIIDPVEGMCIDVIIGDTDEVHRFTYTEDNAWNNVKYIEKDDYLIETGNWANGLTRLLSRF